MDHPDTRDRNLRKRPWPPDASSERHADKRLFRGVCDLLNSVSSSPEDASHLFDGSLFDLSSEGINDIILPDADTPENEGHCLGTRDICYGLLCDINVEPRWVPKNESLDLFDVPSEGQSFLRLNLSFREDHCVLQTQNDEDVAMLNNRSFHSFRDLSGLVQFEGLINSAEWKQSLDAVRKGTKAVRMKIDINAYGPETQAEDVARKLSKSGYFLQHPYLTSDSLLYNNPQYLDLSNVVSVDTFTPAGSPDFQENPADTQDQELSLGSRNWAPDEIMDQLSEHDYLVEAPIAMQILTPLLSHQKEAADFISRRETGNLPAYRMLWEYHDSTPAYYQHLLTGAKSPSPTDTLGGILADEMGLGKSLTMLCQIVATQKSAVEYAHSNTSVTNSCGEHVMAKSTLIVVPSALLLESWVDEINKHVLPGTLKFYKYHGPDREIEFAALAQYDVILTTYGTVAAEYGRHRGMLDRVYWYRLILDEAHVIRNWSTKQFRAISAIPAHARWCLSGTPIQNSLEDLGALVRFLKVPILEETATFRRLVIRQALLKNDFGNLRSLLGSICLRRNKGVLPMYDSTTHVHYINFTSSERAQYNCLEKACKRAIEMAVSGHKTKETHQSVLETLLRLRLFCNNGHNVAVSQIAHSDIEEAISCLQQSGEATCCYCSCDITSSGRPEDPDSIMLTKCRRLVCWECADRYRSDLLEYRNVDQYKCPLCHEEHDQHPHTLDSMTKTGLTETFEKGYPTKLLVLLGDIKQHYACHKSVIFSFWKRSLDIVGSLFRSNGISFYRVDGSLPLGARRRILSEFQGSTDTKVLLMTLGTGAVGLNSLSVANRLHILEPQWNPSVEDQAIGRVLRLGQKNAVTVVRYIVNHTVERSVQKRQHQKGLLSSGGFDHTKQNTLWNQYLGMLSHSPT